MKPSWSALCVVLCGCPYIFEPPDLSNLPGTTTSLETNGEPDGDADTDVDADTDADADVDTDTDTTEPEPPPPDPPQIVQFEPVPEGDHVSVAIAVLEGDAPLLGGTVEVSDSQKVWVFDIPEDFIVWDALGTSTLELPVYDLLPCDGYASDLFATVIDSEGVRSAAAVENVTVSGLGLQPEQEATAVVAPPTASWTTCVAFDSDVPLTGDIENVEFTADASGSYTILLATEGMLDLDLAVEDGAGNLLGYSIAYGFDWESVVLDLTAGTTYKIRTRYWDDVALNPPYIGHLFVRLDD